jgi:ATP-dependent exoDNAse (exonuclease V) alpha subunit
MTGSIFPGGLRSDGLPAALSDPRRIAAVLATGLLRRWTGHPKEVGVSTSLAVRIYKKYGDEAMAVVRDEPYRLAADVWGIGFKTADTIAAAVGIARDSPERIKAELAYTLSEAVDEGHCYLPAPNLMTDAAKILEVPAELITPCLDELAATERVIRESVPVQRGRDRTAGSRRLPAALSCGRTGPGIRPPLPACRAG